MKYRLCIFLFFLGSVFLTSEKFVDTTNTPKFYFVVIFLLVTIAFIAIGQKRIFFCANKSKTILWGISIICFFQACYGLFQFVGWFPSNHSKFAITGSFDNPAGFAAVLAMVFTIGLFLFIKAKRIEKYLAVIFLVVVAIAIFLSGSRTGLLAVLFSSFVFILFQTNIIHIFKKLKFNKLLSVLIIFLFASGSFILYSQKKDSAKGRFLIWKVSTEMIKDKPVFGHGYGTFKAKYMDYQADYFKNNPSSEFAQLADNVKHPFNEFIKITVEFGIVGLVIFISFVLYVLWKFLKSKTENWGLVLSGLASLFIFACFSYPLQYVAVWLLFAYYLSVLLPSKEVIIKRAPIILVSRGVIAVVCVVLLIYSYKQIRAEIKWKTIAMSSLNGNTKKMLSEYEKLYLTPIKRNPFFLYNYGAELNVAGQFDKSIGILTECKKQFNDYDLQMLLADNYRKKREPEKAIHIYHHASNMIPCRFLSLFHIFEIYKENGQRNEAIQYAWRIKDKKVKIPSLTVNRIKAEAKDFLTENKLNLK